MMNFFSYLFLLLLIISCRTSEKKDDRQVLTLKMPDAPNLVDLDTLIDPSSVQTICFKGGNRPIITEIDKVVEANGHFYFLSRFSATKGLYEFDKSGNFVRSIGNERDGEGAFNNPYDFLLDSLNQKIELLTEGKILFFDVKSGKYLTSRTLELGAVRFAKSSDYYVFVHNGNFTVSFTDHDLKPRPINYFDYELLHSIYPFSSFWTSNDKLLFRRSNENTIFSVSKDYFSPYLTVDFNQNKIEDEVKATLKDAQQMGEQLGGYKLLGKFFFETLDYLYFSYNFKGNTYLTIYSKKSKLVKVMDTRKIENKLTQSPYPPYVIGTTADGFFLALVMQETAATGLLEKFGCAENDVKNFALVKFKYSF
jgi:hypothetical protein